MAAHFFGINNRVYKYSQTMGYNNAVGRGFRCPTDVAIGRTGIIYVVNRAFEGLSDLNLEGCKVAMVNLDQDYLGQFGTYGEGAGQFMWPNSIALDNEDNAYITDQWLNRVVIFDKDGNYLGKWGEAGSKDGELRAPMGISSDGGDRIYVVDGDNHRVQIFTKEGKFLGKFGGLGSGDGQVNMPWGTTVDRKGDVYVADWRNDRVQVFDKDGKFLGKFGASGDLVGQFNRPTDVAVDREGDIYVVDWFNHRVQVFTRDFRYITAFLGEATMSKWGDQVIRTNPSMARQLALMRDLRPFQRFRFPVAVDVDNDGRVYIVDSPSQRLQIYQKEMVGVASA